MEIKDYQKVFFFVNCLKFSIGVQLPQSAYNPLDVPYMFVGLGRTNNYIENFNFGIPKAFSEKVNYFCLLEVLKSNFFIIGYSERRMDSNNSKFSTNYQSNQRWKVYFTLIILN